MHTKVIKGMGTKLADWLLEEIKQRDISIREFGRKYDIPASTLNKILNADPSDEDAYPSIATLVKLSRATGVDACTLLAMIAPEETKADGELFVLATRIRKLPPEGRKIVEEWLLGRFLKGGDQSE